MLKTFAQQKLESEHEKDISEIISDTFEAHRCQNNIVVLVAAALGCSEPTLRTWCHDIGLSIDNYRQPFNA